MDPDVEKAAAQRRLARVVAQLEPQGAAAAGASSSPYDGSKRRFPAGPLDPYRRGASFDWEALRRSWFGDDLVAYMDKVWGLLEKDPLFRQPLAELEVGGRAA